MQYLAKWNNNEKIIKATVELENILKEIKPLEQVDFWLIQRTGKMKGVERVIYKLLGLATETRGDSVYMLKNKEDILLVFLDEDDNEFVASNSKNDDSQDSFIDFYLSNGEKTRHLKNECIDMDTSYKAILYFFKNGRKPNWITYKRNE